MSVRISRRAVIATLTVGMLAGCTGDDSTNRYVCQRTPVEHFDSDEISLIESQPGGPEKTQGHFEVEPGTVDRIEATTGTETRSIDVDEDEERVTFDWDHGETVENLTITYTAYRDNEELGQGTMQNDCEWE